MVFAAEQCYEQQTSLIITWAKSFRSAVDEDTIPCFFLYGEICAQSLGGLSDLSFSCTLFCSASESMRFLA
jgi:hypothetical protein